MNFKFCQTEGSNTRIMGYIQFEPVLICNDKSYQLQWRIFSKIETSLSPWAPCLCFNLSGIPIKKSYCASNNPLTNIMCVISAQGDLVCREQDLKFSHAPLMTTNNFQLYHHNLVFTRGHLFSCFTARCLQGKNCMRSHCEHIMTQSER